MEIKDLQGKLVGILGFGQEGRAVLNYLKKNGITPALIDQKPWENWSTEDQQFIKESKVNFIFGPDAFLELKGFDIVFRSPGIKLTDIRSKLSPNCVITSQTKWFFEHCPAKIIGVTGTKGKGTTCSLIYQMLLEETRDKKQEVRVYLTGNIGKTQAVDILFELKKDDWVVYELSSFQLQDLNQSPHVAVVLMTTSEHLDYHKDTEEYTEAKTAITRFQKPEDVVIYNVDYPASFEIGNMGSGKKIPVSRKQELSAGCFIKNKKIIISGTDFSLSTLELQLRGEHNLENFCAAVAVSNELGVNLDTIAKVAAAFKGLEHRLELVAETNGVKFYDDSISTTPETAIAAIESFIEPEILILGGAEKKSDFANLANKIISRKNIKALIYIGIEGARIKQSVENSGVYKGKIFEGAKNMVDIFAQIKLVATTGDIVLLSPACNSFDMFKNYKDRGEQFKNLAQTF